MADLLNAKEHYLKLSDELKQLREEEREFNGLKGDKELLKRRKKATNKKYKKTRRLYSFYEHKFIMSFIFDMFTDASWHYIFGMLLFSIGSIWGAGGVSSLVGAKLSCLLPGISLWLVWDAVCVLKTVFISKKSGYNYFGKLKESLIAFVGCPNKEKDKKISLKAIVLGFLNIVRLYILMPFVFFICHAFKMGLYEEMVELAKPNWMKKVEEKSRVLCAEYQKIKIEFEKLENLDKALEQIRVEIARIEQEFQMAQLNIEAMLGDDNADIQVMQPVIEQPAEMSFVDEESAIEQATIDAGGTQLVFTK